MYLKIESDDSYSCIELNMCGILMTLKPSLGSIKLNSIYWINEMSNGPIYHYCFGLVWFVFCYCLFNITKPFENNNRQRVKSNTTDWGKKNNNNKWWNGPINKWSKEIWLKKVVVFVTLVFLRRLYAHSPNAHSMNRNVIDFKSEYIVIFF